MPIATVTFEQIPCDTFENGERRLIADYSVDCDTAESELHRALAVASTVVFVGGQPVCLLIILCLGKRAKATNPNYRVLVTTFDVLAEARRSIARPSAPPR